MTAAPSGVPTNLFIEGLAYLKMQLTLDHAPANTEIGGFFIPSPNDPLRCIDLVVPKQVGSSGRIIFDPNDLDRQLFPYRPLFGSNPIPPIFWHTHHSMNAFASGDDNDTFNNSFGTSPFAIMLITNNRGEHYCTLRSRTALFNYTFNTPLTPSYSIAPTVDPLVGTEALPIPFSSLSYPALFTAFRAHLASHFSLPAPTPVTPPLYLGGGDHSGTEYVRTPTLQQAMGIGKRNATRKHLTDPDSLPDGLHFGFTSPLNEIEIISIFNRVYYLLRLLRESSFIRYNPPGWLKSPLISAFFGLNRESDRELLRSALRANGVNPNFFDLIQHSFTHSEPLPTFETLTTITRSDSKPQTPPSETPVHPTAGRAQNLLVPGPSSNTLHDPNHGDAASPPSDSSDIFTPEELVLLQTDPSLWPLTEE